ncbi:MAG TPA: ATP-binding protein [Longimicrobiaceae bacterium]
MRLFTEAGPPSLRREIVLWYSLVLLAALGAFTVVTYVLLQRTLERTGAASLREAAEYTERVNIPFGMPRVLLSEEQGRVQMESGEQIDVLQRRLRLADGREVVITASRGTEIERLALGSFRFIALLVIPLTALLAALGGWALLERLLDPLARLVDTTRSIEIGDLSRRVAEPERPAELNELARSFNGMLTRLERAVQALRRFTSDASHELRTPLTSIKGTIQVALVRERSADELARTLEEVLEETEWMLQLVDGLLTLAQGEEGGLQIEATEVDLSALLEDVAEVGMALAREKPIAVETRVPPRLVVEGSAGSLRQVFLNLVSNAVKFTERGSVTITAAEIEGGPIPGESEGERNGAAEARNWVEVRVRDTGIGIAPEELPRVFDRFYRADAARSRPGGTGLGLAIANLLVELHGGKLDVWSRPGEGSEFRVQLPKRALRRIGSGDARNHEDAR